MNNLQSEHDTEATGYDLIEWLMERLDIEESVEAVHIANQLCQYGYFFPVNDSKNLVVKDDGSLYRFQTPYYWPWQHRMPDNIEYAIYLAKRTLRNKQRHGLEEHELEALASLKKNLQNKWDFISMQAEEQVRLSKDRKKGEKIVGDSQERAYWRVHRPPPGMTSSLEPIPVRSRGGTSSRKRRDSQDLRRDVEFLRCSLNKTRIKVSQALDSHLQHCETYLEYDPILSGAQPSNPWLSEDPAFWQFNSPIVETPTEKRVKKWALSMELNVADQTGLQEFTNYLRKEYSHENIRFWMAVNDLRRSSQSQITTRVQEIYEEFLAPGAPCEINIDSKTMERTQNEMKSPTRFTFDSAAEHVYTLLLKKDCYPRFIRSEHFKSLLATGIQPSAKKRIFFGFGGPGKKKSSTSNPPNLSGLQASGGAQASGGGGGAGGGAAPSMSKRRGSDRSLTGSAHELAVSGVHRDRAVGHSHSQSNLSDIPYRGDLPNQSKASSTVWSSLDPPGAAASSDEGTLEKRGDDVCPWDMTTVVTTDRKKLVAGSSLVAADDVAAACPWDTLGHPSSRKNSMQFDSGSSSSELSLAVSTELSDKLRKSGNLQDRFGRRSSSCTVKTPDTRPSVSSTEDFPVATTPHVSFESAGTVGEKEASTSSAPHEESTRVRKKSVSGTPSRKQSTTVAPMISVSPVTESTATTICVREQKEEEERSEEKRIGRKPSVVAAEWNATEEPLASVAEEPSPPQQSKAQADNGKNNDICPWEDEESCKVDTPFVKTYATLGYL
ncbi:hypothetical protein LSTR_LSTR001507 [Laodelphax striatellus]|uniref:RGS domain-containing protein n=2 Tax=Laodelphax striatellus TaxID=195883 RepID=A0A482XAN3_LAOST|nr:hypothetical protein LSTR_LSTR001507 [Laodelphax striatellus]